MKHGKIRFDELLRRKDIDGENDKSLKGPRGVEKTPKSIPKNLCVFLRVRVPPYSLCLLLAHMKDVP
jgi:hypothetical protein